MTFIILLIFFIIRLMSLAISIKHSKQLVQQGAQAYGEKNSKWLAITHILIYVGAAIEALVRHHTWQFSQTLGLVLLIFGYLVLFHVIKTLGPIWTLKLYILPEHPIVKSGLYRFTKHPNYYLNIIPELIGVVLLTHAPYTALLFIPYAYFLFIRIRQEEKLMAL